MYDVVYDKQEKMFLYEPSVVYVHVILIIWGNSINLKLVLIHQKLIQTANYVRLCWS